MPKPYHTPKSERDEIEGALAEAEQVEDDISGTIEWPERDFDAEKDEADACNEAYRKGIF